MKKMISALLLATILGLSLTSCKKDENQDEVVTIHLEDYTEKNIDDFYKPGQYSMILVNYWATFCSPCKKEMVDLEDLWKKYQTRNILIIGACTDSADNLPLIEKLMTTLRVTYPVVYGMESMFRDQEIPGFPTTFILDGDLNIIERIDGKRDHRYFEELLEKHASTLPVSDTTDTALSQLIVDEYVKLEYSVTPLGNKRAGFLLTAGPVDPFYLNGEGYPEMTIVLKTDDGITLNPANLSIDGISTGKSCTWEIIIEGYTKGVVIQAAVSAIACTDEACYMVNSEVDIQL